MIFTIDSTYTMNDEVFPCQVLETANKDVERVAKKFARNYDKSKVLNVSRKTIKNSKIGKVRISGP